MISGRLLGSGCRHSDTVGLSDPLSSFLNPMTPDPVDVWVPGAEEINVLKNNHHTANVASTVNMHVLHDACGNFTS